MGRDSWVGRGGKGHISVTSISDIYITIITVTKLQL